MTWLRDLATRAVSAGYLRLLWLADLARHPRGPRVRFTCNLCGHRTSWTRATMTREDRSCGWCGSSVRFRAVVDAVDRHVLAAVPAAEQRSVRGLGFSDPAVYADALAARCHHLTTFLTSEPRRDILRLETFGGERYDYVVCSEVMEHVVGPVDVALDTLLALLEPGGTLVLTVPAEDGPTREHYPDVVSYDVEHHGGDYRVVLTDAAGLQRVATAPIFHGGPGSTLEMRVWGRDDLRRSLAAAGFTDVVEHHHDVPAHGILHGIGPETMRTGGGLVRGLHSGVWVARRP